MKYCVKSKRHLVLNSFYVIVNRKVIYNVNYFILTTILELEWKKEYIFG